MALNQNTGYGRALLDAVHSAVPGFGNIYIVFDPDDTDEKSFQKAQEVFRADPDGRSRFFTSLSDAYDACEDDNNDVIILDGNSTHALSSMLTISKDRVHFVGLDWLLGIRRHYGQSSKVSMEVTTATTDVFAVKNTGVRNSFRGIKFISNNTLTQHVATFGEGGEYSYFENCEFYCSTKLTSDTHAEMVLNGDSPKFKSCTFGSLADAVSGNKIRPAILCTKETVASGKVCRDVYFDDCNFWKKAGGTTTAMIKIAADADIERYFELHDCRFVANILGDTPAVAIDSPTLTNATFVVSGDSYAIQCTKIATATGIFSALNTKVATATIGIQMT